jgi:hypothetical protein
MRPMPAFSLLIPMPGLPWYLLPLWPLIFWRIQRLKRWFRDVGGPGSEMLCGVMWNGRVVVIQLSDDLSMGPQQNPIFPCTGFRRVQEGFERGNRCSVSPAQAAKGNAIASRLSRSRRKRRAGEPPAASYLILSSTPKSRHKKNRKACARPVLPAARRTAQP